MSLQYSLKRKRAKKLFIALFLIADKVILDRAKLHFACQYVERKRIFSRMHQLIALFLSPFSVARNLIIIMDSYRFKAANYLANFDWISSRRGVTMRKYNRSLIENLICHETANKSTGKSKVMVRRCALDQRIYFRVRALRDFEPTWRRWRRRRKCADKAFRAITYVHVREECLTCALPLVREGTAFFSLHFAGLEFWRD